MFQSKCHNNHRDTLHAWAHKTSKHSHIKSETPVSSQDNERSCILRISILPLSTIFLLEFGTVSTMFYFCFFILLLTLRFTVLQIFLWYITCFIGVNKIWDSWLYLTFYTLHNILVIWRFDTRGSEHNWWDDYIKTIENPHCKSEGK
jgi:hypothetical protein